MLSGYRFVGLPVFVGLFLVACNTTTVTPASTQQPQATPSPSSTLTSLPPTATHIPSATITSLPTAVLTATFVPTLAPATPAGGPESYRLKEWGNEESLQVLSQTDGVLADFYAGGSWVLTYGPDDYQNYLVTLLREHLLRGFGSRDAIQWRLAFQEASTSKYPIDYSTSRFREALEALLNSGVVGPDQLAPWLQAHQFELPSFYEVPNLFGINIPGYVIQVRTIDPETIASYAFFAISRSTAGEYHVKAFEDKWITVFYGEPEVAVNDRNRNSIADTQIVANFFGSGQSGCIISLYLYEWQGSLMSGRFVDIARNVADVVMGYNYGECEDPWEFEEAEGNPIPALITSWRLYNDAGYESNGQLCPEYVRWIRYVWDGAAYVKFSEGTEPFEGSGSTLCAVGWAKQAGAFNDEAVTIIASALQTWSADIDNHYGPAAQDYFRFKLGVWYARRGQDELAKIELARVRDHPINPAFDAFSQMARVYLQTYPTQGTESACEAAMEIIEQRFATTPPGDFGFDLEVARGNIGYVDADWKYGPRGICDPERTTPWPMVGGSKTYVPVLSPQSQEITAIETLLFEAHDAIRAKDKLNALFLAGITEQHPIQPSDGEPDRTKPYLRYLLGLTYEIAGDERSAVQQYWQLWDEYPDNPYALIARQKLEPLNP